MKKQGIVVFFLALVFAGALVYASLLQAAEIISLEGNVQVQSAGDTAWSRAGEGMRINAGDSLRTARGSGAVIALDAARMNTAKIDELTMVVLNSATPGMIDRFDLSEGKVYANVESIRSGLTFEVSTPSSVAGVRGTGYSVDSNRDMDEVSVFRNEIFVKAFDQNKNLIKEITVPEGFKTLVERFQGPSDLVKLTDNEKNRWNDIRREMAGRMQKGKGIEDIKEQIGDLEETMEEMKDAKDLIEERGTEEYIGEEEECEEMH